MPDPISDSVSTDWPPPPWRESRTLPVSRAVRSYPSSVLYFGVWFLSFLLLYPFLYNCCLFRGYYTNWWQTFAGVLGRYSMFHVALMTLAAGHAILASLLYGLSLRAWYAQCAALAQSFLWQRSVVVTALTGLILFLLFAYGYPIKSPASPAYQAVMALPALAASLLAGFSATALWGRGYRRVSTPNAH